MEQKYWTLGTELAVVPLGWGKTAMKKHKLIAGIVIAEKL